MENEENVKSRNSKTVSLQTPEGKCIATTGAQARDDEAAKNILSHKQFLARILKETVAELADFSIERIIRDCLTEPPAVSSEPLDREDISPKIESHNTEDTTIREGKNFMI